MMKKLLPLSAAIVGAMFSAQALAIASQGTLSQSGSLTPDTAGTNVCTALSNNVTIQLSNGVIAGYACTDTSFSASTCHTKGSYKQQTIPCTYQEDTDPDTGAPLGTYSKSAAQCPDYDPAATAQAETATFLGRVGYKGGSSGGTVSAQELPDTTVCDSASVESIL